jgi:hypothetical protein
VSHKKASNFASKCELGRLPIISFITSLTFKYYSRLKELLSTRLVKEAFGVDNGLFNSAQKSWYSLISNSAKKIYLTNLSVKEIPKFITNHYEKFIKDQLKNYMKLIQSYQHLLNVMKNLRFNLI